MNLKTMGFAACLAAAVTAGCGTVTASQPPVRASHGPAAGCPGGVPAEALTITLAGNGKTYCVRVGEKLDVYLNGTVASMWLAPLASSNALQPSPDGALSLVRGLTGASFAAARPGQVLITSVRPPCQFDIARWKQGGLEPASPLPRTYPLQSCPPQHRFSTTIIVVS